MAEAQSIHGSGGETFSSAELWKPRKEKRLKWLVIIWMLVVFYWPVMNVGGIDFRADYPFALLMALWLITQRWGRTTQLAAMLLLFYAVLLTAGTINGVFLGYPFNIAAYIGFLKFFLVATIWAELLRKLPYKFVIYLVPIIALPTAIFAFLQISVPDLVSNLTVDWYSSAARTPTEALFGEAGRRSRAVSVFEHPANAAFAFLLCIVFSYASAEEFKRKRDAVFYLSLMLVYFLAGLASGSSTFILGAAIVTAMITFRVLILKTNVKKWISAVLAGCAGGLFIIYYWQTVASEAAKSQFSFQVKRIMSGEVLASRLGPEGGLWEAITHWPEFLLSGLGAVHTPYFTGDSLYIGLVSKIGIFGATVLLIFAVCVFKLLNKYKDPFVYVIIVSFIIILAAGLGTPTLIKPRFLEVTTFLFAAALVLSTRKVPFRN